MHPHSLFRKFRFSQKSCPKTVLGIVVISDAWASNIQNIVHNIKTYKFYIKIKIQKTTSSVRVKHQLLCPTYRQTNMEDLDKYTNT